MRERRQASRYVCRVQNPPPCLAMGNLVQMSRKNTEELTAEERGVKNKCEKLDHGTWHLEMKQDFSGRL